MSLFAAVLPFALGAMISPTVLTIEILILSGTKNPKVRAWLYAIGAGAVLLTYGIVIATILGNAPDAGKNNSPNWVELAVKILAIIALLILAARVLRKPPKPGPSKLSQRIDHAKGFEFLIVGALAMATNFSTLVLYWPGVHTITTASADVSAKVGAAVMLYLITLVPALGPILLVTVLGKRADGMLHGLNHFVTTHAKQINAGILVFFAVLLVISVVKSLLGQ